MPPKFDFAHTTQLDTIELLTSRPSRIDFDAGDGLHLVVEAPAPGVFRLRCGEANHLTDDKPGARARAVAEMLLARQEAVGEAAIAPREGGDGWRVTQGDVALELQSNPVRFALYRNEERVFESEVSAHTPAFGHNALDQRVTLDKAAGLLGGGFPAFEALVPGTLPGWAGGLSLIHI